MKQSGSKVGHMQKRLVVLTASRLEYYKDSHTQADMAGAIFYSDILVCFSHGKTMNLRCPNRNYLFNAESQSEAEAWTKAVNGALATDSGPSDHLHGSNGRGASRRASISATQGQKLRLEHARIAYEPAVMYDSKKNLTFSVACSEKAGGGAKSKQEKFKPAVVFAASSKDARDTWVQALLACSGGVLHVHKGPRKGSSSHHHHNHHHHHHPHRSSSSKSSTRLTSKELKVLLLKSLLEQGKDESLYDTFKSASREFMQVKEIT